MTALRHILMLAVCLLPSAGAADELSEARRLAPKYSAAVEVRLLDGTRVDLLSEHYAIEVDWAPKWAEAIGQSLHYSQMTQQKPAIILLLKDPETEWQHLVRAAKVCGKVGIQLYVERVVTK